MRRSSSFIFVVATLFATSAVAGDRLHIAECQRNAKTLDEKNCAMAKRVVSRSERKNAGLCTPERYTHAKESLAAALKATLAADVLNHEWPWEKPVNLEACGYLDEPNALDLDLTLQIPGKGPNDMGTWLHVDGYTTDGKRWVFDDVKFSNATVDTDARVPLATREALRALLSSSLPWFKGLKSSPKLIITTSDSTLNFRDFKEAPPSSAYLARIDVFNPPDECAQALVFVSGALPLSVTKVEQTAPRKCPPPVY